MGDHRRHRPGRRARGGPARVASTAPAGAAGVVVALSCAVNAVVPLAQAGDEVAAKEP